MKRIEDDNDLELIRLDSDDDWSSRRPRRRYLKEDSDLPEDDEEDDDDEEEVSSEKESRGQAILKEILHDSLFLLAVFIITLMLVKFVGQRTVVVGESMETTLQDGDNLIVDKITYRFRQPERFEIIVFPYIYQDETYYIKRVIGLPGETVRIDENGTIFINDVPLEENYGREVIIDPGNAYNGITLGEDQYFVLGDNRNHSSDSRFAAVGIIQGDRISFFEMRKYDAEKMSAEGVMADKMTITEIKKEFDILSDSDPKSFIKRFESDERTQVKNLVARAEKKIAALEKEKARMIKMFEFERRYSDYSYICGIDEVGRGPLAGPVVAGAVILPRDCDILYLNDSKQLSEKKREELYSVIMEKAVSVGLGFSSHELIDEINILQATYAAMREAVSKLDPAPDLLLTDAVKIPELTMAQVPIIKGDTLSASISAASIVAKVTRDRMMVKYDEIYPEYGFAKNKGYGSSEHIEALKKYGPTPIHRRSFIKNFV